MDIYINERMIKTNRVFVLKDDNDIEKVEKFIEREKIDIESYRSIYEAACYDEAESLILAKEYCDPTDTVKLKNMISEVSDEFMSAGDSIFDTDYEIFLIDRFLDSKEGQSKNDIIESDKFIFDKGLILDADYEVMKI